MFKRFRLWLKMRNHNTSAYLASLRGDWNEVNKQHLLEFKAWQQLNALHTPYSQSPRQR